jgi:hypothetical protein
MIEIHGSWFAWVGTKTIRYFKTFVLQKCFILGHCF